VGGVVVADDAQPHAGVCLGDEFEEGQELDVGVARVAGIGGDVAGGDVQCGPRGVKGSNSPRYCCGTIYHYVAAMGYDDTPGARAVWIADSGFWPFGYWCGFDQVATLIPPKGYTYADAAP
jgi:hypothetical protein